MLGQAFRYVTPGEMYSDIFGGNAIRILTVIVAFLFSVPYLGVQLKASGSLFNILTEDWISVNAGMYALTAVVVIYVASGGLRSVAYVDCAQCVLLAFGIVAVGIVAIVKIGGWSEFVEGMQSFVSSDLAKGENLTPAGHSHYVALPGSIQAVSASSQSQGGPWTGIMCMTYMFALMGIQASPAFSMWAFANKTSRAFRWQQVVASSLIIGIILFTFTIFQGVAGWIFSSNGTFTGVNDKTLVPELINLLSGSMPCTNRMLPPGSVSISRCSSKVSSTPPGGPTPPSRQASFQGARSTCRPSAAANSRMIGDAAPDSSSTRPSRAPQMACRSSGSSSSAPSRSRRPPAWGAQIRRVP